jgi:3-hydroxyisobutyrate dehydrogenase
MGQSMAQNLVRKGHAVRGFDIRPEAIASFENAGGETAASAAECARCAEFLVVMVLNAAQAEAALLGDGAVASLAADATVILMSTCPPGAVESIASRVAALGRRLVDAPVSGGANGAKQGTLTIMAAAPRATFERTKPLLEGMGSRIFHVGERPGQGAAVKTVSQLLVGVHTAAAAEALSLASKAGIDCKLLLEICSGSSAASWMLNDRGASMLEADPLVTSTVDIFVKDLAIVLEAGRTLRAALPLAAAAPQMFIGASGRGHGPADYGQVIRAYRDLSNG